MNWGRSSHQTQSTILSEKKRCTPVNTVLVMGVRITIIYMYSRIHVSCKTSFTCIQEYMYHCAAPLCYYPAKPMFVRGVKQTKKNRVVSPQP